MRQAECCGTGGRMDRSHDNPPTRGKEAVLANRSQIVGKETTAATQPPLPQCPRLLQGHVSP